MHARTEDRIEIESLMKRYCLFFDTKRADDLALLFTADAVIDYGPEVEPIRGRVLLREMVASGMATRFESTHVAVVGAGVSGLAAACEIARAGRKVSACVALSHRPPPRPARLTRAASRARPRR